MDRLKRVIRRHVLGALPGTYPTPDASTANLLIDYKVWRGRFVRPTPRRIHVSTEMAAGRGMAKREPAMDELVRRIEAGADLTPQLSAAIHRPFDRIERASHQRSDRDLLLADRGIHHLHLSTRLRADGTSVRTDDVLFVVFAEDDAYLLGIHRHPRHANWAARDIFAVLVRNWPGAGVVHGADGVIGLSREVSDDARLAASAEELRRGEADGGSTARSICRPASG